MRKISIILLALCVAGAAFAQETKLSVGGGISLEAQNHSEVFDTAFIKSSNSSDTPLIKFGAFVDATYLVFGIKYGMQFADTKNVYTQTAPFDFSSTTNTALGVGNLEFSLAGKVPIKVVEGLVIFPLLGVEYDLNLTYLNKDSLNAEQKSDLNDLYLLLGLGADLYASPTVFFRPQVNFGLNLTAAPTSPISNTKYSGYKFDAGIGIGFTY